MGLKILVVSVEVAPFAKVGGLADVAASLPKALRDLGHDARIFMPGYGMITHNSAYDARAVTEPFQCEVNKHWSVPTVVKETSHDGVPVWLLDANGLFDPIMRSEDVYTPNRDAYLYMAKAILESCERLGWIPDVVHCNDWHTGLLPVILRELGGPKWASVACVYTIHNLAYQGEFGPDTLPAAGLPEKLFNMHQLETFGGVNFLKSGCVFSEQVNTVSPTYAKEILTEEYGCGLWGVMRDLTDLGRLRGILNGIDTDFFDPKTDKFLPANYSADDLSGKASCKTALQRELELPVEQDVPIVSMVTRLSNQKGFDHVIRAAYGMLDQPVQFVVLAVGDPWAAGELHALQREWPDRVRFVERYDAPLAQRIYGGSDMFLMPSAFEPCGLGQLIALRYGTIPVVRRTGGLADTVFEGKNGFVFEHRNPRELHEALKRAVRAFGDRAAWQKLVVQGMSEDYGWSKSAVLYVAMYEDAIRARKGASMVSQ